MSSRRYRLRKRPSWLALNRVADDRLFGEKTVKRGVERRTSYVKREVARRSNLEEG
jgi:hypothetical protein